jgi:hypothetical protein
VNSSSCLAGKELRRSRVCQRSICVGVEGQGGRRRARPAEQGGGRRRSAYSGEVAARSGQNMTREGVTAPREEVRVFE